MRSDPSIDDAPRPLRPATSAPEAPTSVGRPSTQAGEEADAASRRRRRSGARPAWATGRPSAGEWVLFAYLAAVSLGTLLSAIFGEQVLHVFATSPDEVAKSGVWTILMSGLIVQGPAVPQIAATAVLGVSAIRLAGARVFWSAAIVAHFLATLLVYAAVWIADAATSGSGTPLSRELDFGISLVWCAALGVLAAAGWWSTWRLPPWLRYALSLVPPAAIVVVTLGSDGLAMYEHAVAFALAVLVVFLCRRWASLGRRLRLLWLVSDGSS